MQLLITFIVGAIGGVIFYKMKFPAGAMVGAMLFTALFNIITSNAYLPNETRVLTQMVAGAFIGHSIKKRDVLSLKKIIFPAFLMILLMIILDMGMGFLMFKITKVDLATALMACAPGGMMDISILSSDVGADSSKVALLQLMRLMTVMSCFPLIIKFIATKINKMINKSIKTPKINEAFSNSDTRVKLDLLENDENYRDDNNPTNIDESHSPSYIKQEPWYGNKTNIQNLLYTLGCAFIFGMIGYLLKIPAGAMTFSMIFVALFNITTNRGYMPIILRRFTQILAGILIGSRMTYEDLIALKIIILPAFILLTGIVIINFIVGIILHKVTKIDLITCLIAATPGGLSDMVLISKDLGADQNSVAILQLFRYVFVIAIFPIVIRNLLTFIN